MLRETKAVRGPSAADAPHLAMKDRFFDWPYDDLGQFVGDLELKVALGASAPRAKGRVPSVPET
jgi:hypothetical protein